MGAAVNVVVAWCFAVWATMDSVFGQGVRPPTARPDQPGSGWLAPVRLDWPCEVPDGWELPTVVNWSMAAGCRWDSGVVESSAPDAATDLMGRNVRFAAMFRFGWPSYSLYWRDGTCDSMTDAPVITGSWSIRGGTPLPPSLGNASVGRRGSWYSLKGPVPRRLPLLPVLPGFIVNSALYGLVLAGVVLAPRWVVRARRSRRRRRGLCASCGYEVGQLTTCPECGTAGHSVTATIKDLTPGPHE